MHLAYVFPAGVLKRCSVRCMFPPLRQISQPHSGPALARYKSDARFAATLQDAEDAAAALVTVQDRATSVESDNRRLVEQVSPIGGA